MHDTPLAGSDVGFAAPAASPPPRHRFWQRCGAGAQFHVFDLGDGRVLKVPRSLPSRIGRLMLRRPPLNRAIVAGVLTEARQQDAFIDRSIAELMAILPRIDRRLVGHPTFYAGRCYAQQKATPLREAFAATDTAGQRRLLDLYIEAVLDSWRNGFCELSFDFLFNAGLASAGHVMFLDLAGISAVQRRALRFVARRDWLLTSSYMRLVRENLDNAAYFIAAAERALTPENLRVLWGTALEH
jgi:hypothetical protein